MSLLLLLFGSGTGGSGPTPYPTPATPSTAILAPSWTAGFTGKCRYRPWSRAILDGVPFYANGWDDNWRWDPGTANSYPIGSTAPTTFGLALTGASGWLANGSTAFYYLEFYNSALGKATAPQTSGSPATYGVSVTNGSGGTRNIVVTWTDPVAEWDKVRIWRRLQNSDNFRMVAEVAIATATYTDTTTDTTLQSNGTLYVPRYRTTLPPIFAGIVQWQGRLFGWTGEDSNLYYAQQALTGAEFVCDDFPDGNILQAGVNDGLGAITAVVPYYTSLLVFKERGCYEVTGDSLATWAVSPLFEDRGAFSPRVVAAMEGSLMVLDRRGLYEWRPGMQPSPVGALDGTDTSPLQPIWDRMNTAVAGTFFSVADKAQRILRFHVALDFEPTPNAAVVWDYAVNRLVSVDTAEWGCTGGYLFDAAGVEHVVRLDDIGFLWEENYGTAEGLYAGDSGGAITSYDAATFTITASGAAFSTNTLTGIVGCPMRRYSGTTVLDTNRVWSGSGTTLVPYLFSPTSTPSAAQTCKVGIVASRWATGKSRYGTSEKKHIRRGALEFDEQTTGTLAILGTDDDGTEASLFTLDMSQGVRGIFPVKKRTRTWRLAVEQDDPAQTYSVRAMTTYVYAFEDRRP